MAGLGPVSSLAPSARLLALLLLSSALFMMPPAAAALFAVFFAALLVKEGIAPARLLRESLFLLWMAALALALQGLSFTHGLRLDREGLAAAMGYSARLLAAFWAGRLFYAATTRVELRDAVTAAVRRLPGKARGDVGLALFLVLGFLPRIVEEWRASRDAAASRALPKRPGFSQSAALLSAFLRRLMLMSLDVPEALRARAWSSGRRVRPIHWRIRDYGVNAAAAVILALSLSWTV